MKSIGISPAAFEDRTGIGSRSDTDKNSFLSSPDLLDAMRVKVGPQFCFDNLGGNQERHFAKAREMGSRRRVHDFDVIRAFQKLEWHGFDRPFARYGFDLILK